MSVLKKDWVDEQYDYRVVNIIYTEYRDNAALPVRHCNHNKINAASITEHFYPHLFFVTTTTYTLDTYDAKIMIPD